MAPRLLRSSNLSKLFHRAQHQAAGWRYPAAFFCGSQPTRDIARRPCLPREI